MPGDNLSDLAETAAPDQAVVRVPEPALPPQSGVPDPPLQPVEAISDLLGLDDSIPTQRDALVEARDALELERQRYQDLFDLAPDGYLVTTPEATIHEANRTAAAMLGAGQLELAGKPLLVFVPEERRAEFREQLRRLERASAAQEWEAVLRARTGVQLHVSIRVTAVRDLAGRPVYLRWLLRDVTEKRRAEEQVRRLNAELEQRVLARTAELEQSNRQKDELLRREHAAREEAEASSRRFRFLSEVGAVLAESLDYSSTLSQVARLAMPYLGDWCIIDAAAEDGSIHRVTVAHADPADADIAADLEQRYPPDWRAAHGAPRVLRTGEPELLREVPDDLLVEVARDPEHLEILRALGLRSAIIAPLVARGRTLGILSVSTTRTPRSYGEQDLALVTELARRVALALDNARLHSATEKQLAELMNAEDELERKQERIEALNDRLRRSVTETHHRVKNNLQVIAAMIDVRLMDGGSSIPTTELRKIGESVRTVAAVHDILTAEAKSEGDVRFVSAEAVLEKVISLVPLGGRRVTVQVEDVRLPARQVTALALVVNELFSNAVKHGGDEIHLHLETQAGFAMLSVSNNGPGFPPEFDPRRAANTGLELVESLSRWDLGGHTRYENRQEGGARVVITIPLPG